MAIATISRLIVIFATSMKKESRRALLCCELAVGHFDPGVFSLCAVGNNRMQGVGKTVNIVILIRLSIWP